MASAPATIAALVMATTALTALPAAAEETATSDEATISVEEQRAQGTQDRRVVRRERASRARTTLIREALSHRGKSYVAGAAGPNAFDCSGFTMYVYKKALGKNLPHYSGAQMSATRRVSVNNLKPGDLLFYGSGGSQHVSMYIGKGKMIHATNPREGVVVQSIRVPWFWNIMVGAGRVIRG